LFHHAIVPGAGTLLTAQLTVFAIAPQLSAFPQVSWLTGLTEAFVGFQVTAGTGMVGGWAVLPARFS